MSDSDGAIRITLRDVYEKVELTERNVALLVLGAADAKAQGSDHETRIRAVERRVWAIPSAAVLLAAASLIVSLLMLSRGQANTSEPSNQGAAPAVTQPHTSAVKAPPARTQTVSAPSTVAPVTKPQAPVRTTPPTKTPAPVVPRTSIVTVPNPIDLVNRLSGLGVKLPP